MRTNFDAIRRVRCLAWAIALVALAAGAQANAQSATIVLTSAWMRPALAGPGSARAYVDIATDTTLTLTQATTPVARTVEFVVVATGGTSADETVVATVPVKRLGEPGEIASIIAWLASHDGGYSTGADFSVNGGLHMG